MLYYIMYYIIIYCIIYIYIYSSADRQLRWAPRGSPHDFEGAVVKQLAGNMSGSALSPSSGARPRVLIKAQELSMLSTRLQGSPEKEHM